MSMLIYVIKGNYSYIKVRATRVAHPVEWDPNLGQTCIIIKQQPETLTQ
jgi:hypothetical protein